MSVLDDIVATDEHDWCPLFFLADIPENNIVMVDEFGNPKDSGVAYGDIAITWQYAWSAVTAYVANDMVSLNGSSYICIQAHTNQEPPNAAYWDVLAQKGTDGDGTGDVVGPGSATDNALARYDTTTGKLIQNSAGSIDDEGVATFEKIIITDPKDSTHMQEIILCPGGVLVPRGTLPTTVTTGSYTNASITVNADGRITTASSGSLLPVEVDGSTNQTLSVAQVSGTIVNNYGQGAANITLTLPVAAAGYNFIGIVGTTQAGNTWQFKASTNDKIYLNGTAGTDNQSAIVTPAIGNYCTFFTFKTGASAWDWIAKSGNGTWTAGA